MKKYFLKFHVCVALLFSITLANAASFNITGNTTTAQSLSGGQTGTVTSTGNLSVSGGTVAITLNGSSASLITLTNSGTIKQTGTGRAIRDNTGGLNLSVTNNAGALIQTADADPFQMAVGTSSVTLNNSGSIVSLNASLGGAQAIDWNAITTGSNTLNNFSTGLIKATAADAVRTGVNGVVVNAGTILSVEASGSTGSDGIDAQSNTGVNITNSGTVEAGRHGITGGNTSGSGAYTMSITNQVGGTIQGNNGGGVNIDGINANEVVTITNHGTITGNGITGDGDGVDVDGLVNLNNTGIIRSINANSDTSEGVTVGGGTIINSGTIEGKVAAGNVSGAVGRGITVAGIDISGTPAPIYGNTTITNSGLIKGDSSSGIAILGAASGKTVTITNNAGGTIQGGGATAVAVSTGANDDTVINSGTVKADNSGKAIDLGGGTNSLQILGGSASVIGDISGGTGTSSMTISPGTGNNFTYLDDISNFSSVSIQSGRTTLAGNNSYTGTTTVSMGATFAGTGASASAMTVQAGATVEATSSSGSGAGIFGAQNIFWNSDNITAGVNAELGTTSDLLNMTGAFTKGTGTSFLWNFSDGGGLSVGTYLLANYGSTTFSASDFGYTSVLAGLFGNFTQDANHLYFTVASVPEHGSYLLVFEAIAFLFISFHLFEKKRV